jgi:hypothetical protein
MARVTCSIRAALPTLPQLAVHPVTAARALQNLRDDDESETSRGPGWFDSSWDLQRGLEVREGLPGNASLNEWLAACLQGG